MQENLIETVSTLAQECLKSSPVIVLGSGASVPFGLPSMVELAQHLTSSDPADTLNQQELVQWDQFVSRLQNQDLESALASIMMSESLSDYIVRKTWKHINTADLEALNRLIGSADVSPFDDSIDICSVVLNDFVSVVTTNYDRLAEYAADRVGLSYYTGFTYGYLRTRQGSSPTLFSQGGKPARTIEIWKVHGSLDWFMDSDDQTIGIALAKYLPDGFRPAIVTPGVGKYEQTHLEPFRTIITRADYSLSRGRAYLCIGFGFNDDHIQPKLMERWQQGNALLVILTKELTDSARYMLAKANGQRFLALEEASAGTQVWSNEYPGGEVLHGVDWWRLDDFITANT